MTAVDGATEHRDHVASVTGVRAVALGHSHRAETDGGDPQVLSEGSGVHLFSVRCRWWCSIVSWFLMGRVATPHRGRSGTIRSRPVRPLPWHVGVPDLDSAPGTKSPVPQMPIRPPPRTLAPPSSPSASLPGSVERRHRATWPPSIGERDTHHEVVSRTAEPEDGCGGLLPPAWLRSATEPRTAAAATMTGRRATGPPGDDAGSRLV